MPEYLEQKIDRLIAMVEEVRNELRHRPTGAMRRKEFASVADDRLIRLPEVVVMTGLHERTIFRMQAVGKFPRSVKLTPRAIAWRLSDIQAWVASRETVASP